jgi:hypothetical protein
MMKAIKASTGVVLLAGVLCAGCQKDSSAGASAKSSEPMAKPQAAESSTMTTTKAPPPTSTPPIAAPAAAPVAVATTTPVPEKDLTHVLSKDEPYYASSPSQGRPADGTLKAGTKVLVMMPRGSYSQVVTADGKRVYTSTAGLKPIGS